MNPSNEDISNVMCSVFEGYTTARINNSSLEAKTILISLKL